MELYGGDMALYTHPGVAGWTLRVSREPRKHDDPRDKPATYVGLIHFGEVLHCRIVLPCPEGGSEARAEIYRQFEQWVYEYVAREHSGNTEPGEP